MNTRQINADLENLKVFETLVDTMRTLGSALYPRLKKKISPAQQYLAPVLFGIYSTKSFFSGFSLENKNAQIEKIAQNIKIKKCFLPENQTPKKYLIVPIGSNRSFCGDINRKILKTTEEVILKKIGLSSSFTIAPIGRKLNNVFSHLTKNILPTKEFPEKAFSCENPQDFPQFFKDFVEISSTLNEIFFNEDYTSLIVIYTDLSNRRGKDKRVDTVTKVVNLFPLEENPFNVIPSTLAGDPPENKQKFNLAFFDSIDFKEMTGLEQLFPLPQIDDPLKRSVLFDTLLTVNDEDSPPYEIYNLKKTETTINELIDSYFSSFLYLMMLHSITCVNFRRMNSMNEASKSIKDEILKFNRILAKERKRIITKNLIEVIAASIQEEELEKQIR